MDINWKRNEKRKKWESIHPLPVQNMVKKWGGGSGIEPNDWPKFMEDFKKLSQDEKFELTLWWTCFRG